MANQTFVQCANAGQISGIGKGAVYKKSTTLADVSPGGTTGAVVVPANYLEVGKIIRFTACGIYSNTSAPKLIFGLYYGGVAGTALAETIEVTTPSGVTNQSWGMEATSIVQSIGPSGKIITQGNVTGIESVSLTTASASTTLMPEITSTGGEATINTEEAKILTVGAKWLTESESNALTCYQFLVEFLN
jgi:hypothetical protein